MAASCDVWEFPNEVRPGWCGQGRGWRWCPDRFPARTWPTCHHTLPFHSVPTSAQSTGWSIMRWWDEMILFYGACRVRVLFWFPSFLILERRGPVVLIPETHFPLYGVTQSWPWHGGDGRTLVTLPARAGQGEPGEGSVSAWRPDNTFINKCNIGSWQIESFVGIKFNIIFPPYHAFHEKSEKLFKNVFFLLKNNKGSPPSGKIPSPCDRELRIIKSHTTTWILVLV